MPVDIEALLQPIAPDRPSGDDLRYHPVTDQIREARRQEDSIAQGVWKRDVKNADYLLALKLGCEALGKRSKDLQIAAWIAEALLHLEGFRGLRQGLELIYGLLDRYWDSVYPLPDEDDDLELRATPLRFIGSQLDGAIRSVPLNREGHGWAYYKESRSVPTEDEAQMDVHKQAAREEALAEGRALPEEFQKAFDGTPAARSRQLYDDLSGAIEFAATLAAFCDGKFGNAAPALGPLGSSLEEVQQTLRILLKQRGLLDAPPAAAGPPPAWDEPAQSYEPPVHSYDRQRAAPCEDPVSQVLAAARLLRQEDPSNPAAYLVPRALRWGELRASNGFPDPALLAPPTTETRMELKRLAAEGSWDQITELAETTAGEACGRAWLDVQRYAVTACRFAGNEAAAQAILSGLRSLLADFPQFTGWMLADDTPVANAETMAWLAQEQLVNQPADSQPVEAAPQPVEAAPRPVKATPPPMPEPVRFGTPERTAWGALNDRIEGSHPAALCATLTGEQQAPDSPPDAFELACEAARSGDAEHALGLLSREMEHERSGRARFLRKVQLAHVCLATSNPQIARPVLEALAEEIDRRQLEDWEAADFLAQPLALLYQCCANGDISREKVYDRVCRLDPTRALALRT